jgi:site-specific DNA recombinase
MEIPVPALIDEALFEAAQVQLEENRKRKREGLRRPGWLLQGLVVCRRCGYAFYGKMARGLRGSQRPADYGYYRCTGTDAHASAGRPCAITVQSGVTSSTRLYGQRSRLC